MIENRLSLNDAKIKKTYSVPKIIKRRVLRKIFESIANVPTASNSMNMKSLRPNTPQSDAQNRIFSNSTLEVLQNVTDTTLPTASTKNELSLQDAPTVASQEILEKKKTKMPLRFLKPF